MCVNICPGCGAGIRGREEERVDDLHPLFVMGASAIDSEVAALSSLSVTPAPDPKRCDSLEHQIRLRVRESKFHVDES